MNKLKIVAQRETEASDPQTAKTQLPQAYKHKPYRIFTLGHIRIFHHGELVNDFGRSKKKPMDMLKLLIALGGCEVSQEKISSLLWPDADGDAAQQTFDTTLHRLRKLVGSAKLLLLREGRLSLNTDMCWLDCWSFEKLQRKLEKNLNKSLVEYVTIQRLAEEFLELYPAHFLYNDNELPWLYGYRQSLQSKYIRTVNKIGQFWQQQKQIELALELYLRVLEMDWYLEEFYQRAMLCYEALGLRAEGLMLYQRCRLNLLQNMNITPSAKTESIRMRLMGG